MKRIDQLQEFCNTILPPKDWSKKHKTPNKKRKGDEREPMSLQQALESGKFVVTAEIAPPQRDQYR